MKIVFLTDSITLGESGVGDYSLHLCSALNAQHIDAVVEPLGAPGSSLRDSLLYRIRHADPDWLSFQFVPYSYAHRGLVGARTFPWHALRGRVGTHVMFHELWIGSHRGASLQERLMGVLQRRGIQRFMSILRPDIIHCGNSLYSAMLHQAGLDNRLLPLFGNIPITTFNIDPYEALLASFDAVRTRSGWIVAALFGSIYPSINLSTALRWLQKLCFRTGQRLCVISLGLSRTAEATFAQLTNQMSSEGSPIFLVKGCMEPSSLSSFIYWADCGLATTPFNVIEKSGSAIAFAEHGVPVIVMDAGSDVIGVSFPQQDLSPEFWLFGDQRLDVSNGLPPRRDPRPRLNDVANQFLEDLKLNTCSA